MFAWIRRAFARAQPGETTAVTRIEPPPLIGPGVPPPAPRPAKDLAPAQSEIARIARKRLLRLLARRVDQLAAVTAKSAQASALRDRLDVQREKGRQTIFRLEAQERELRKRLLWLLAGRRAQLAASGSTEPPPATAIASSVAKPTFIIDVETTGTAAYDRIISMAVLRLEELTMCDRHVYMCFDPRKNCHPDAARVNGWDDWTTRFQDLFSDHAAALHEHLSGAELLVMHNADFDMHYINREFRKCGLPPIEVPVFCTMQESRAYWPGQRASLDACLARLDMQRDSSAHNAFEDAFHTMNLYRFFRGAARPYRLHQDWPMPTNFKAPPPRPSGNLPRRTPKRRKK